MSNRCVLDRTKVLNLQKLGLSDGLTFWTRNLKYMGGNCDLISMFVLDVLTIVLCCNPCLVH
jgi:hypothetical protein